jgi:DNA anti-recombination protein RmuC
MRAIANSVLTLSIALACAACSDSSNPPANASSSAADKLEQKIAAADERLKALGARMKGDKVEAEYHDALASLEERRVQIKQKLEKLGDDSASAWSELKSDLEKASLELEHEIEVLAQKIDAAITKSKS